MNHLDQIEAQMADFEAKLEYLNKRTGGDQESRSEMSEDFAALVEAEIRKGVPRAVAGQRVFQKYGARPNASAIRKGQIAAGDFAAEVDAVVVEKRCSRAAAMTEVRRRHPELFEAFKGVE